jgi:hypothetical protein
MMTSIQQVVNSISMQKRGQMAMTGGHSMSEEKQTESINHKVNAKSIDSMFLKILMNLNSPKRNFASMKHSNVQTKQIQKGNSFSHQSHKDIEQNHKPNLHSQLSVKNLTKSLISFKSQLS